MHNKRTGDDYEEKPEGVEIGVEIEHLRKVFKVCTKEMSSSGYLNSELRRFL